MTDVPEQWEVDCTTAAGIPGTLVVFTSHGNIVLVPRPRTQSMSMSPDDVKDLRRALRDAVVAAAQAGTP